MNLRQLVKFLLWRDTTHHGEFAALRRLMSPDFPKVVVDVGANDGFKGSNSYPFVARGWRAILIEPHPAVFAKLQERFAHEPHTTCLNLACSDIAGTLPMYIGADGKAPSMSTLSNDPELLKNRTENTIAVKVQTLNDVFESLPGIPPDIGLLTVDAEGMDYEVLLGLDFNRWRPRIIITEDYKPKIPKKAEYLTQKGYRQQTEIKGNSIWTTSTPLRKGANH